MKILQIGIGWFPSRTDRLNRYHFDCANYFFMVDIQLDDLVARGANVK